MKKGLVGIVVFCVIGLALMLSADKFSADKDRMSDKTTVPTLFSNPALYSNNETSDFEVSSPDRVIELPSDHGAHPMFRNEWWYLTANLIDEFGREWGVQWTLFRYATAVNDLTGWQNPQRYMAHFVITSANEQVALQRFARGGIQQAAVVSSPYEMWIDNWHWQGTGQSPFPGVFSVEESDISAKLTIQDEGSAVLQGKNGYSTKNEMGTLASHYFSHPYLNVEGTIEFKGKRFEVTGSGWYDREWSSQSLLPGENLGWDWFALHLSSQEKLMIARVREGSAYTYFGSLISETETVALSPQEIVMKPLDYGKFDGNRWPLKWKLYVPSQGIDIMVSAKNHYPPLPLLFSYWEGPVSFIGSHTGVGYMELTGY